MNPIGWLVGQQKGVTKAADCARMKLKEPRAQVFAYGVINVSLSLPSPGLPKRGRIDKITKN
jgi:hypothetical protein